MVMPETDNPTQALEMRVTELERLVAHLEAANTDLSDMVARQWEQIDRLTRYLHQLHQQVQELEPEVKVTKPPHY